MKKFIVTILAVLYLGVSSGATVNFHYCMGQLIEWGLVSKQSENCSKCGMNKTKNTDCCKDQYQKFKVEESQKASQNVYQFNLPTSGVLFITFNEHSEGSVFSLKENQPFSKVSQQTQNIPVFIRNCNFRI